MIQIKWVKEGKRKEDSLRHSAGFLIYGLSRSIILGIINLGSCFMEITHDTWFAQQESKYINFLMTHALASKPFLYKDIASIYEQDELLYYNAYQSLDIDLQSLFQHYPFEQVNAMMQVLGILVVAERNHSYDSIWTLIRKGFGFLWKYTKNHRAFSFVALRNDLVKKTNGFVDVDDLAHILVIGLYITSNKDDISPFSFDEPIDKPIKIYLSTLLDSFRNPSPIDSQFFNENYEKIGRLRSLPDLEQHIRLFRKSDNIEDYISKVVQFEVENSNASNSFESILKNIVHPSTTSVMNTNINSQLVDVAKLLKEELQDLDHTNSIENQSKKGWSRYIIPLRALLLAHDFDPTTLGKLQGFEKGMDATIFKLVGFYSEEYDYTNQELMLIITIHYYLSIIETEYKKLRELASDGSKERMLVKVQHLKEKLVSTGQEAKEKETKYQLEINTLQHKLNEALEENSKVNQSLRKLKKENEETINHSREIHALRSYVTNHIQEVEIDKYKQHISIEHMMKSLQKMKIAIVGGHHNWQRKMKIILPAATFLYVDDINRSFNALRSVDYIFLNSTVLNHGFSYKLMNVLETIDTPFYYLSDVTNRDLSIKEIYNYIHN